MKIRTGTSSRRWAFMRRMTLRRHDRVAYLDRIRVIQTPWFGIYLHRFDAPDPGLDLHDHPWPFVSMVFKGFYQETHADSRTPNDRHLRGMRPWRPRLMRLGHCHTINYVEPGSRSIVLVGRSSRNWGFFTPEGFVPHEIYDENRRHLVYQEDA